MDRLRKIIREQIISEFEKIGKGIRVPLDYEASRSLDGGLSVLFSRDQSEKPIGLVPMQSLTKNKIESKMLIRTFLKFASEGGNANDWMQDQIRDGRAIAPPFLTLVYVESVNAWYVRGHEGRSRCKSIKDMADKRVIEIPVDIFLRKQADSESRSNKFSKKDMSKKAKEALKNKVVPQEYSPIDSESKDHWDFMAKHFDFETE